MARRFLLIAVSVLGLLPPTALGAWSAPIELPTTVDGDADGRVADLAVGAGGRALVAVRGRRPIVHERPRATRPFTRPVEIGRRTGRIRDLRVALGADGAALIAWTFRGRREVRWAWRPAGEGWGPVGVIRPAALGDFGRVPPLLRLSIDRTGRGVLLLTPGRRDAFRARLLRQRVPGGPWDRAGADLAFDRVVHDGFEADFAADAVAMDDRGGVAVAAVTAASAPRVVVMRRPAGSMAWTAPRVVGSVASPRATHLAVAVRDGVVATAWSDARGDGVGASASYDAPPTIGLAVRRPSGWRSAQVPALGRRPGDVRVAVSSAETVLGWSFDTRNLPALPIPSSIGASIWRQGAAAPDATVLTRSEGFLFGYDSLTAIATDRYSGLNWVIEHQGAPYETGLALRTDGAPWRLASVPEQERGLTLDAADRVGFSTRVGFARDGHAVAAEGSPRGRLRLSFLQPSG